MARFRFELEALLEARRRTEKSHQRGVAELEQQRRGLEDRLRRQQEHITEGKRDLGDRLVGSLDLPGLRSHAGETLQMMRQAHRLLLELAAVHKRLEHARSELVEAARARRGVEILREKRFREWQRRMNKAEDAALDELASRAAFTRERSP